MMENYGKISAHAATMRNRFIYSIAAFAVFAIVSLGVPAGASFNEPIVIVHLCLLGAALFILPRSTAPTFWPKPESEDEDEKLDVLRTELRDLQVRCVKVRVVYFILLIPLLLLPSILRG